MNEPIYVSMLGGFSISRGGKRIDDSNNRMRKVWLLLAYLIYARRTKTTQEQFLSLTQGSTAEIDDPSGRLKALFYRARAMLEPLGDRAGHAMILNTRGSYSWNTDIPLTLDAEEFDRLCSAAPTQNEDTRLELLLQALELYQGDFLPKLSMESWVMPISAYYHQRYLDATLQVLSMLVQRQLWQKAQDVCVRAIQVDPYNEDLYQYLMRCQIALNNRIGAVSTYEAMSELLFENFGVMPSDESRRIYREASRESNSFTASAEEVRDQLKEAETAKSAVLCEYDFFKLLYQVQARSIIRSGDVIHIALLSLHGTAGRNISRRSLDTAMDNLQSLVLTSLRQGDVVTRYSASQLIIMLPQANLENSRKVCQRITKAFARQYPHSPAEIQVSIHPLEPHGPGLSR